MYLFYNVDLLKACSNFGAKTTTLSFVNDVNILIYGINTEKNCRILKKVHKLCAKWANTHEAEFASFKYELIHLTRNVKKFNMKAMINIEDIVIELKSNIRVLRLQIDFRLKWDPHVKKIQTKMSKQKLALSRLTVSTWGATLAKIRTLYSSVVRPSITYISTTWKILKNIHQHSKTLDNKLNVIQNDCLKTVIEVYKITSIKVLKAKAMTKSIIKHMNNLQVKTKFRLKTEGGRVLIEKTCAGIARKLQNRRGRRGQAGPTPSRSKHLWAEALVETSKLTEIAPQPPWAQTEEKVHERIAEIDKLKAQHVKNFKIFFKKQWKREWSNYQTKLKKLSTTTQQKKFQFKKLRLHKKLTKSKSFLTIQIRSKKIKFVDFLFKQKIFFVIFSICLCGHLRQMIKYVLLFCSNKKNKHRFKQNKYSLNYRILINTVKKLKNAMNWLLRENILPQFSLMVKTLELLSE